MSNATHAPPRTMAITVMPNALLATVGGDITLDAVNAALAPHNLWLPLVPWAHGLTIATALQHNSGAAHPQRYGRIAAYVRGATVQTSDTPPRVLSLGGATLKRATGYGLARALVGNGWHYLPGVERLLDVTVQVVPRPAARLWLVVTCPDDTAVTRLYARLVQQPLHYAVLHVLHNSHSATGVPASAQSCDAVAGLVVALDGTVPVLQRQADQLAALARQHAGVVVYQQITDPTTAVALPAAIMSVLQAANPAPLTAPVAPVVPLSPAPTGDVLATLHATLPADAVVTDPAALLCYRRDASIASSARLPRAVVLPHTTDEVQACVRVAATHGVPIVTRGAGSGLAGGVVPYADELVLSLTRLTAVTVDAPQRLATVGAGATVGAVQAAAAAHELFYAPDPSSWRVATVGGTIACNAGGPRCLKYGVTAAAVAAVTAVRADGTVLRVGDGIAGYRHDPGLLHLLIGSEGTLAIITGAVLRLLPQPATQQTTLVAFADVAAASATVAAIMARGIVPASLELLDSTSLQVLRLAGMAGDTIPPDAGAVLLLLADGEPDEVCDASTALVAIARQHGASTVQTATTAADEARLWQARRSVSPAFARLKPHRLGEDICVPLPQIVPVVAAIAAIAERYGLTIPVFGHAGDGNLHPNILFDQHDPDEARRAWQAAEAIFRVALDAGGTLSGEHGIGTLKRPYLAAALGDDVLRLHRDIKQQFDPHGLLNPGKVVVLDTVTQG